VPIQTDTGKIQLEPQSGGQLKIAQRTLQDRDIYDKHSLG